MQGRQTKQNIAVASQAPGGVKHRNCGGQNRCNSATAEQMATFLVHEGCDRVTEVIDRRGQKLGRQGRLAQGASTITQQLVRMNFLESRRTIVRKLREDLLALAL